MAASGSAFFSSNILGFQSGASILTINLHNTRDNYNPAIRFYETEKDVLQNAILTTEILKSLAENSIYDLNPQSILGRDEMDGLEATYWGADFVAQKISNDEDLLSP
ncbi:hypothetical protein AVEN_46473-1 [Araneus ventricosus]|uniref:Uncharacterized protein n=1 Tax=Araneus ventricosus TaxID=182803 RepID=A0A4Y2SJZ2_ARAVE|nr:hypothetical protein AVEN_23567-1 [Araneus ventricosus]GBN88113.1 hypothetical protein AVEN_46473-1 [Araneus ventricosus]